MELKTSGVTGKALGELRDVLTRPPWPDAATHGTSEQAQRNTAAMADLFGVPSPNPTPEG